MKHIVALLLAGLSLKAQAQTIRPGHYGELDIAYNPVTKIITGYFESYTGYDEQTGNAQFSCIFYLEGKVGGRQVKIKTAYTVRPSDDVIYGDLELVNDKTIKIHLPEEHGGCWNVQHFADEAPAVFTFEAAQPWTEIRYVVPDKAYFFGSPSEATKRKAFIVKGDIVKINKIDGSWASCSYNGKKTVTTGWIRLQDLNQPGAQ